MCISFTLTMDSKRVTLLCFSSLDLLQVQLLELSQVNHDLAAACGKISNFWSQHFSSKIREMSFVFEKNSADFGWEQNLKNLVELSEHGRNSRIFLLFDIIQPRAQYCEKSRMPSY